MTESAGVRPLRCAVLLAPARRQLDRLPTGFRRVAASTGWLAAEQAARLVVGLLVGVYVARHLGPESFGVLSYAISFVFLFSALGRLGLDNLVVRDLVALPERQAETLGAAFVLRLAGGALAAGLVAAAAWGTQADPTTRFAILIIALGLIFQSLEVAAYWFYAQTFSRPVALARLIALAAVSALRIVFILLDKPVLWFAWPVMLDATLAAVFTLAFYLRRGPSPGRWRLRLPRVKAMLKDAWPLALSFAFIEMQLRIDQLMLGELLGPREVGWYAAAARLSQMLYVLPTLIGTATFPSIIRAKEASQPLYDQRMQAFYDLMLWLGIALALPGAFLAGPLVHLLYGAAYGPTALILQIHIWSFVFVCVGTARGRWLVAEGLVRLTLLTSLVGMVANVTANYVLIPNHGGLGAAWATLLAQLLVIGLLPCAHPQMWPTSRMIASALLAPRRWLLQKIWNQ